MSSSSPCPSPPTRIIATAGILFALTAGVVLQDELVSTTRDRAGVHAFQRMAGGLGLGATVCPRWCFVNFDPRLEPCTCPEQPLPGGYCYCPEHSGTVTHFVIDRSGALSTDNGIASAP